MAKFIKDDSVYADPTSYLNKIVSNLPSSKNYENIFETEEKAFENSSAPMVETYNGKPVTNEMRENVINEILSLTEKFNEEAEKEHRQYSKPDRNQLENTSYAYLNKQLNRLHEGERENNNEKKQMRFVYGAKGTKSQSIKRAEQTLESIEEEQYNPSEARKSEKNYGEYWVRLLCKYLEENLPEHPIFAIEQSSDAIGRKGEKGRINEPAYNRSESGVPRVALSGYVSTRVSEEDIKSCVNEFGREYPECGAKYESGKPYFEKISTKTNPASKAYVEAEQERMEHYIEWIIWVRFEGEQMKNMYYTKTASNKPSDDVYAAYVREYGLRENSKKEIPYSRFNDAFGENPLENSRSNMLEMPNEDVVFVEYLNGKLIGGILTNVGLMPMSEIEYDEDMTVDANLQALYDKLIEEYSWGKEEEKKPVYHCYKQTRYQEGCSQEDIENGDCYETAYIVVDENGDTIWDTTDYRMVKSYFEDPNNIIHDSKKSCKDDDILEEVKEKINDYCFNEFGYSADFDDLSSIGLAYTTLEDGDEEVQINANIKNCSIDRYLNGKLVDRIKFEDLKDMSKKIENYLDFDELTYFTDNEIKKATKDSKCKDADIDEKKLNDLYNLSKLIKELGNRLVNFNTKSKNIDDAINTLAVIIENEFENFNVENLISFELGRGVDHNHIHTIGIEGNFEEEPIRAYINVRLKKGADKYYFVERSNGQLRTPNLSNLKQKRKNETEVLDSKCKDADEWRFKLAKRRNSYDEYVIRAYKNGKYDEEATYYTDDWDDAVGTLTDIAQRQGLKVREEKYGFVADSLKRKATKKDAKCKDDVLKNYDKEWHFTEDEIFDVAQYLMNWYPESVPEMEAGDIQDRLYGADGLTFEGCPYTFYMEEEEDE